MPSYLDYQAEYGGGGSTAQNGPLLSPQQGGDHELLRPVGGLLQDAKKYLPGKQQLQQLREDLEGPKPLRVIVGLAGLALSAAAALGLLNIFRVVTSPARSVLECYEMIFGLMIAIIEIKAFVPPDSTLRSTITKWFPFLTVLGGKGLFNVFVGSLGMGFGVSNLLLFVPAAAVMALGVVYVLFHLGKCNQLLEKYDQTVYYNAANKPHSNSPAGDSVLFTA